MNIRKLFIVHILFYQYLISPIFPRSCMFEPTCSEYSKQAILKYGFFYGTFLGIKRILRCHPWGGSGKDPLK